MSDESAEVRDQKAWRRVIAACRKLAKQYDVPELGEAVATANHQDIANRDMRRSEALAALLEVVASEDKTETDAKPKAKAEK